MLIEVRFLAGRYHATPWGRHVNEGAVEWPPSPWRICRAVLATGYRTLGWRSPPAAAIELVEKLAGATPRFHLPPANAAHTRHYMPKRRGSSDRVLDAFAYVGRDDGSAMCIEWDVALTRAETELLDQLLEGLAYIGRAESWVAARRVSALPAGLAPCAAAAAAPGPGFERVALLAPMGAAAYAEWRAERLARARGEALEADRANAESRGKKPKAKLTAKDEARLASAYPDSLVAALSADTASLRAQGWSQPPGSVWLSFYRRADALDAPTQTRAAARRQGPPNLALLALSSDTKNGELLPKMEDAIRRLDALHQALVKKSDDLGAPSPCFTGHDESGKRLMGHQHAVLVPLCLDGARRPPDDRARDPRRIDHVLVHCRMGFDDSAVAALERVRRTWATGIPTIFVTLVGLGRARDIGKQVPAVGTSKVWTCSTPFVPPRYLKRRGKDDLGGQVRAELESRRIPSPESIEVEVRDALGVRFVEATGAPPSSSRYRHHRKERPSSDRQPPQRLAYHLRLTFASEVTGPIAIGYGSHFGLGAFEPSDR